VDDGEGHRVAAWTGAAMPASLGACVPSDVGDG